ncbi:hypothetical protein C8R47DRAFT_1073570 [Mycena vitilis]|nr:hypothetical protein C8R47DRAFT_1073570 [Mycena vitilis]
MFYRLSNLENWDAPATGSQKDNQIDSKGCTPAQRVIGVGSQHCSGRRSYEDGIMIARKPKSRIYSGANGGGRRDLFVYKYGHEYTAVPTSGLLSLAGDSGETIPANWSLIWADLNCLRQLDSISEC